MTRKLFDHLVLVHRLILLSPPNASFGVGKFGKNEQSIFKELSSEHLAEEIQWLLQLLTESRFFRVHNDEECIYVANVFQTNNHFSNVLRVSIPRVTDTGRIYNDDGPFIWLVKPPGQDAVKCWSFWLRATRSVELFFAANRVGCSWLSMACAANHANNLEFPLYFFLASCNSLFEFFLQVFRSLAESVKPGARQACAWIFWGCKGLGTALCGFICSPLLTFSFDHP